MPASTPRKSSSRTSSRTNRSATKIGAYSSQSLNFSERKLEDLLQQILVVQKSVDSIDRSSIDQGRSLSRLETTLSGHSLLLQELRYRLLRITAQSPQNFRPGPPTE